MANVPVPPQPSRSPIAAGKPIEPEWDKWLNALVAGVNILVLREQDPGPGFPPDGCVAIFAQDAGGGKTQLMAQFNTGAAQQIAVEP